MKPARSALLISSALPLAFLLAACGGEQEGTGKRKDTPSAPLGFELAMAGPSADEATASAADNAPMPASTLMIDLTPAQLAARLAAGNIRLIDVRTDAEVAQGMIPGAEHIPLDQFDPASLDLSDGGQVVLYCRSGRRSAVAGEKLAAAIGKPVEHLAGGILAWEDSDNPIEPR